MSEITGNMCMSTWAYRIKERFRHVPRCRWELHFVLH